MQMNRGAQDGGQAYLRELFGLMQIQPIGTDEEVALLLVQASGAKHKAALQFFNGNGCFSSPPTAVEETAAGAQPQAYALEQNAPNPFNPVTAIRYDLPVAGMIQLSVYNIMGQKVTDLVHQAQESGSYTVRWDGLDQRGRKVAAGVYIYSLRAGDFSQARKMVLLP
jgi:hypothetical protein